MPPARPSRGTLLRRHRKRLGLLGLQAAMRWNVSPSTWSRYETDRQEMPADLLARIAERWQAWDLLVSHPVARATVISLDAERQKRALSAGRPILVWAWAYPDGRLEPYIGEPSRPLPPGGGMAAAS